MKEKNKKFAVVSANNESSNICLEIFETKLAAFNHMKKDVCGVISNYSEEFQYKVVENGRPRIISRKDEYDGIQLFEIEKDSAEVLTTSDDRYWWQIKKVEI